MVSAYSPIGAAPAAEREDYATQLQLCFNECGKDEVLIVGSDTNASAGARDKCDSPYAPGREKVRGPYGIKYQNAAGRELCTLLGANELCLPTTYFQQRQASGETYGTWQNPCSKLYHQNDQFFMRQKDLTGNRTPPMRGVFTSIRGAGQNVPNPTPPKSRYERVGTSSPL